VKSNNNRADFEQGQVRAALLALADRGLEFSGPFETSKGIFILVENHILKQSELLDMFAHGELSRESIQNLIAESGS
jgi:hypothetical protein